MLLRRRKEKRKRMCLHQPRGLKCRKNQSRAAAALYYHAAATVAGALKSSPPICLTTGGRKKLQVPISDCYSKAFKQLILNNKAILNIMKQMNGPFIAACCTHHLFSRHSAFALVYSS
jgi:hypothetical protein